MAEFDNNTNNPTNLTDGFEETTTGPVGNVDNSFQIPENATILAKPTSGRVAIDVDANSTYAISFDANDAQLTLESGDLVFNFNDGTQLILGDFAEVSPMPTIMLSDGTILAGDVVVAQLQDPSTDVFNLETAAGESGGDGQFSYDDDLGSVIDLLGNLPPLPFTTLAFSTFEQEDFNPDPDLPGTFIPKFFTPFAAGVAGGFEDWQPNQHVGDLTEFPMQLVINYTPPAGDNDVVDAINIADIPTDVRVFIGTPGVPGSFTELTVVGGEVDITSADLGAQSIFMLPPENSDADFTVTVNLETRDPDTNEITMLSEPAVAIIDAVADKPEIDGTVELADGTIDGSAVTGADGQNVKFNIDIDFFDNDGSETHTITVTGVPQAWTLVGDDGLGATATPQADGTVTHTVTVGAGFDGTLEFNPNAWNSDDFGTADVTFTANAEEVEFDQELLLTNNESEVEQTFQVTLTDDVPKVTLVSGPAVLLEDDLTIPGPDTVDGTITVDFFSDAPGSMALTTDGLDALGLTSEGDPLSYEVSPDGLVITATDTGGDTVFTVTLDPTPTTNGTEETYTYTFELNQPLDHDLPGGAEDTIVDIPVQFVATDSDGDTATGQIDLQVVDDTPVVQGASDSTDETGGLGTPLNGDLGVDLGADGAGDIDGNDTFTSSTPLFSGGEAVTVTFAGGVYTGETAGGDTVFTATINDDGTYTFVQELPLDHPDTTDSNDTIDLEFGFSATDYDGDTTSGSLNITVFDDGPAARNVTTASLDETDGLSQTANGVIPHQFGEDGAGTLDPVDNFTATDSVTGPNLTSGGEDVTVTLAGDTFTGTTTGGETVFTMTINDDGSYDFEIFKPLDHADGSDANDVINLNFDYQVVDGDGDVVTGTVTVPVVDDVPIAADDFGGNIYNDGPQTVDGNVLANDDGGEDLIGDVTEITANGTTVTFAADAQTDADGTFIEIDGDYGTLKIYEDGDYTYTVTNPAAGNSGWTSEEFHYTMDDTDTDTDSAKLHFCVERVPNIEAVDVENEVDETFIDQTVVDTILVENATGFALTSDVDSDGSQLGGDLTSNGVPVTTALVGGQIVGSAGGETVFTVDLTEGGEYTFTLLGTLDHADPSDPNDIINLNFTYEASGVGGQSVEGAITIHVLDDAPTAVDDGVFNVFNNGVQTVDGNVLANDDFGQDDAGDVTAVSFGGTTVSFDTDVQTDANGNFIEIDGQFGTLKLYEGGDFDYTVTNPPAGNSGWVGENFEYTMDDYDGDTDTALIKFCVQRVPNIEAVDVENEVDETFIDQTVVDTILVENATGFALGTTDGSLDYSSGGSQLGGDLTSNGVAVVVALVGGQIVGSASGETIFTLDLSNDGTYSFTLLGTLDHADASNPNDIINLDFTYTVENTFGQAVEGNISIDVLDDVPVPCPDRNVFEGVAADGNVITGEGSINNGAGAADGFGQDGPGDITQVEFDGNVVTFAADAQTDFHGTFIEIEGENGTLKLYEDGDYQYVLNDVDGAETCVNFDIDQSDIVGDPTSITENGITISVGNGDSLTFLDTGTLGSGIGVNSRLHNSDKIFNGESININFDDPTTMVDLTVADIGYTDAGDSIGVKIYYSATEFIIVEQEIPNATPANGLVEFTIDAGDYSFDEIYQIELFSGNAYGHNCPASFLLNDVKAYYTEGADPSADEFTYTIADYDGDEASTTLTFEATDPSADSIYDSSVANSGNLLIENDVADEIFYDETADTLDISDLLSGSGYQPGVSDIADFLQVESSGEVHVDIAGTGSFDGSNVVGTFEGGTAFDTINVVLNDDEGDIPVQIV